MEVRYSDPMSQYQSPRNLLNRELVWEKFGVGAGKYGIDFVDFQGNELVLDIGSGTGRDLAVICPRLKSPSQIAAVDISPALLQFACDRICVADAKPDCRVASADSLPFANEAFDVVIAKHVLNHVDDLEKGISEVCRVLKSTGKAIITAGTKTESDDFLRIKHLEALIRLGIKRNVRLSRSSFNCNNAGQLLRVQFPTVAYHFYGFRMVFPRPEDFMLYYTTLPCFQEVSEDPTTRTSLASTMLELISKEAMPIVLDRSRGTFVCTKK